MPQAGPGLVELPADLRHAVRDRDHGAQRRRLSGWHRKLTKRDAEPRQHRLDVVVVGVEIEQACSACAWHCCSAIASNSSSLLLK